MKKVLYILAVVALTILNATPVLAATTAVVTILGIPAFTAGGILSFNVIYVSNTEADFNWQLNPLTTAINIMIRGEYNRYPSDIPNENTTPSDGYLVYYGDGIGITTATDNSLNLDDNAATLYYKAWAQRADGTWFVTTRTSSKESREVVLIGLILIGMIGSVFAIMKRNMLFAVGAGALWFFLITYTRANPLPNIAVGSNADGLFIGVCVAFSIGTILSIFWLNNNAEKKENPPPDEQMANRHNARGSAYETPEQYQARLYAITHPKRK